MNNILLLTASALLIVACSQPAGKASSAETATAENTQADGTVNDKSTPPEQMATAASDKPMDVAMMSPAQGDSEATGNFKAAMMKMMRSMPPYTGDADVDFNKQMRGHHLAAIDMAAVELAYGKDAKTRALATKIMTDQKREVAQIDAWLKKRGQ